MALLNCAKLGLKFIGASCGFSQRTLVHARFKYDLPSMHSWALIPLMRLFTEDKKLGMSLGTVSSIARMAIINMNTHNGYIKFHVQPSQKLNSYTRFNCHSACHSHEEKRYPSPVNTGQGL